MQGGAISCSNPKGFAVRRGLVVGAKEGRYAYPSVVRRVIWQDNTGNVYIAMAVLSETDKLSTQDTKRDPKIGYSRNCRHSGSRLRT